MGVVTSCEQVESFPEEQSGVSAKNVSMDDDRNVSRTEGERNVHLSHVDYIKVNNSEVNNEITSSDYDPDKGEDNAIGISVKENLIPIRGTISFRLFIDSYFISLGSPSFGFGGNYYPNSLKDHNTNYFDGDGNPINISDYSGKHELIYMETTIDYDFSLDGYSEDQNLYDFGIRFDCNDYEEHNVMWITWPYGVTTGY